ncbi:dimethyladenosine transferase [Abditibacterium utsteinense]|uniref:Ribosomal RNA small subunit methyltransferase A n=1 Tax=Abditibacterium utsteinense TaxID=1960156 RepID=A0A2S8SXE1_9BACT|nr:16S rRNA (adenine(1518)-N(6)/adenine(1519)-N(6))-dimethyltransferase RsmA [Abditibacterium utsteinense]PQV65472.1 dimethyladenosine transferase [Abditibacterium utsteinense]
MSSLFYDPSQIDVARDTLTSLGASPNKTLSQNFLVDSLIIENTIEVAKIASSDAILEIGPGLGALTVRLLRDGGQVVSIEKDRAFAAFLRNKLRGPNFSLVEGDALDVEWNDLKLPETKVKLVANLPFSISKPMLRRIMEEWRPRLSSATVLVQREVADRLISVPGTREYGPLTIMSALYARVSRAFDVPPESFLPPPNVVSTVVHIELLDAPTLALKNEKFFWQVVRAAFSQRRKTLGNTMKTIAPREITAPAFEKLGIDPMRRGETLSLLEFSDLSDALDIK